MDVRRIAQEMRPVIYQAGHIAMQHFRQVKVERKADESYVTDADREVETFLKEEIHRRYADHGFFGEEYGHHRTDEAEFVWAIDPIDGTAPFVFEMPIWAISVGLLHEHRAMVGFVYLPVIDEMYWAVEGDGAFVNNQRIYVNEAQTLSNKTTILAPSATFKGFDFDFEGRSLSLGSAAAHMCYVARGKIHGGIIESVKLYDIAASAVIIKEAGGVIRYLAGDDMNLWELIDGRKVREPFVFGNSAMADHLIQRFSLKL